MSANFAWVSWKDEIGLPNCSRTCEYATAASKAPRADPERQGGDGDPPAVQDLHRLDEALPLFTEQVLRRNSAVLEDQRRRVGASHAELVLFLAGADPRADRTARRTPRYRGDPPPFEVRAITTAAWPTGHG